MARMGSAPDNAQNRLMSPLEGRYCVTALATCEEGRHSVATWIEDDNSQFAAFHQWRD